MCTETSCGTLSRFTMAVVSPAPFWEKREGSNKCFFFSLNLQNVILWYYKVSINCVLESHVEHYQGLPCQLGFPSQGKKKGGRGGNYCFFFSLNLQNVILQNCCVNQLCVLKSHVEHYLGLPHQLSPLNLPKKDDIQKNVQWNLSKLTHQGNREMCQIVQDVTILRFNLANTYTFGQ